jgi:DNA polymerase-1
MPQKKETVYLVDGSSYFYRAYHAIRYLSNSKGFPTNLIFGFTKMVLKLLEGKKPTYLAIVFDVKGPTFRHKMYPEYKANRPPMPEDMAAQIPMAKAILKDLNIRMVEKEGYEADDIIGTLARVCEEKGHPVVMVTGDKDFRQLITPNISMWDTMKDAVTGYKDLKELYGLEPRKFIDIMGLSGDRSDNIPGVPGIGEKTAVNLVKEFGSLENVFAHVEQINKNKLQENLKRSHEDALLSKELVTIDQFVSIDTDPEQLRIGELRRDDLAEKFRELEFKELWDQFSSRQVGPRDYSVILSKEDLLALVRQIKETGMVSLDTETTSKNPCEAGLVGISFCCEESTAFYLPFAHTYQGAPVQLDCSEALDILRNVLEDERVQKIGQNIKYDGEVLKLHGVDLEGIYFDTMIASYVLNPGLRQHNLGYLAQHYLNHKMINYGDLVGKGKDARSFTEIDVEQAMSYSCEDADMTLRLKTILDQKLSSDKNQTLFHDLEMKLLPVLMDMELTGITIDTEVFKEMSSRFAREISAIKAEIFEEAGMEFNINSSQQLGFVLFEKLQLPGQKKTVKTKRYSTDVKVLRKLAASSYKIPTLVLRYRTLSKLKSTYLDALVKMVNPSSGRLHTSYNQTVTATGRLSSSNPNLQNIPIRGKEGREIRKGFVAADGTYLVSADYSQVELRVFAHYSGDEAFIEAFNQGEDIHTRTASEILGVAKQDVTSEMRRIAKAINFGIIYGMGPRKLSEELGIDYNTARKYIETYYERYQGVTKYRDKMIETARKKGFVTTLFNRRRYLPDIRHKNRVMRAEAERMAVNTPIQGTAADLIKKAMINIHGRLTQNKISSKMLLQVHDELVFEVPEEELAIVCKMIKQEMEEVYPLKVPLKVDINKGKNWAEAH